MRTPRELKRRQWQDLLADAHYGLGWRIYRIGDDELYLHSGWVRGYVTEIAYSRKHDVGLALLLNGETPHINRISTWFWANVHGRQVPAVPTEDAQGFAPPSGASNPSALTGQVPNHVPAQTPG